MAADYTTFVDPSTGGETYSQESRPGAIESTVLLLRFEDRYFWCVCVVFGESAGTDPLTTDE